MYRVLEKGEELRIFTTETMDRVCASIEEEITIQLKKIENPKPLFAGCLSLYEVPLKKGGDANLWVEYTGKLIKYKGATAVDTGITRMIIYDEEIPDVVLDRYNEYKNMKP